MLSLEFHCRKMMVYESYLYAQGHCLFNPGCPVRLVYRYIYVQLYILANISMAIHTGWFGLNTLTFPTEGWTPCEFINAGCCWGMPAVPPGHGCMFIGLPMFWFGLDDGMDDRLVVWCPIGPGVGLIGRSFKLKTKWNYSSGCWESNPGLHGLSQDSYLTCSPSAAPGGVGPWHSFWFVKFASPLLPSRTAWREPGSCVGTGLIGGYPSVEQNVHNCITTWTHTHTCAADTKREC